MTDICQFYVAVICKKFNVSVPYAHSRSLGNGNVFTHVCNSVHRGPLYDVTSCLVAWSHVPSGGLCPWSHVPSRGLCLGRHCPENPQKTHRHRDPTFKRALRILLECALVLCKFVAYQIKSPNINSISKCIRLSFCYK